MRSAAASEGGTAAVVSCPAMSMVMRSSRSWRSPRSASRMSTRKRSRDGSRTCAARAAAPACERAR